MKKLLLITSILVINATLFSEPIRSGFSTKIKQTPNGAIIKIKSNKAREITWEKDITTGDHRVNRRGAVIVFRDKGEGWEDQAATHIGLRVLQPVKIESEIDEFYDIEVVKGDNLIIDDIGFTVRGQADTLITFEFLGPRSNNIFDVGGYVKIKDLREASVLSEPLRYGASIEKYIISGNSNQVYTRKLELDLYLELADESPGVYNGIIIAKAKYQ